ncbi:hypothetical protein [uncultured Rikenella sp.]|uniref:hypothetical protein n=1 Tax=uncultured Rikenella sp. TaxID=368003 RepID=UPI00260CB814|nr:hypothetical protein [uncultured Rikenella sp.]
MLPQGFGSFFPAPGFRDAGNNGRSGALCLVGEGGYIWSSTAVEPTGMDLNFHSHYLDPYHTSNRGYGFQLRCLSE